MTRTRDDEFARAIGHRIETARLEAGHKNKAEFCRQIGNRDQKMLRRWEAGEALPSLDALMAIADVCQVSLDWIAYGREETPSAFLNWLDTALGTEAQAEHPHLVSMIRALPLRGYRPTRRFYDAMYLGMRDGLHRETDSPVELVRAARSVDD